ACDDSDDDGLEAGGGGTQGTGNCDDGIDNDADNKIDGNDPECQPYMDKGELATNPDPLSTDIWGTAPQQGIYFHAMPWDAVCVGETDTDSDGYCDDLETALGSDPNNGSESDGTAGGGPNCANDVDDDGDTYVNDGCPIRGDWIEKGAECAQFENTSNDTVAGPDPDSPDDLEQALGVRVNDGCPVIGVPESLVIDNNIQAGASALPAQAVPQSCTDGVDNDGDTAADWDNQTLGCDPGHASYDNDADRDGVADGSDNCPVVKNPEQTNSDLTADPPGDSHGDACDNCRLVTNEDQTDTDGDGIGDACEGGPDSDNDGFSNTIELYLGTDPFDNCPDDDTDDAWPLDMDMDTLVTVVGDVLPYVGNIGLLDTDPGWSPAVQRLDLNGDGGLSVVSDVWRFYSGMFASGCDGGTPNPPSVSEGSPVTMGIDPETTGNSADMLGDLEECVRVDVDPGDFDDAVADHTIDVYVTDVTADPTGYDAWITYQPDRVDPVSWDDLIKLPGALSLTQKMEDVSRLNAGALYTDSGTGIGGDGTVLRINLDAISAGAACFGFGFAKAYSSSDVYHPTLPLAASLAINTSCETGDSDGDGVIDMCDNCRTVENPGQEDLDGDRWGDVCDYCLTTPTKWYTPPGDDDCDGFSTAVEVYLGTDPEDPCPDYVGHDVWPFDINMDQYISVVGDVLEFRDHIGAGGGPPPDPNWEVRLDLNMDDYLSVVGDVLMYRGVVGESCT
ncbi:MAG: hypothetical protein WBF66_02270, partial [Dehalococcoidia bacterium]